MRRRILKKTPFSMSRLFARHGHIRADGLMEHDMYLFEVKKPEESKGPWDYYKLLATVPGSEAFSSLESSKCPLVRH